MDDYEFPVLPAKWQFSGLSVEQRRHALKVLKNHKKKLAGKKTKITPHPTLKRTWLERYTDK